MSQCKAEQAREGAIVYCLREQEHRPPCQFIPMTPPDMVTDATATHWTHWAKQDVPDEYPLWRERASRLLADRERLLGLLVESRLLMPILHMNFCPEAHQGGECDCGGDARAKWGDDIDKLLEEAHRE